jgi:2'-5' RNA ligase
MQRYSIFLTPSGTDFEYTATLIRELCYKYDEQPFEPHITLLSGNLTDLEALKKVVAAAASGIPPFSLPVRTIGCSETYFRSLFIEFEETSPLWEIRARLRSGGETESADEFVPHLSLLYSEMPLRHKEALAKRLALDRSEIHCDELKIVTPRNREQGWRDTGQWQILYRVTLGTGN